MGDIGVTDHLKNRLPGGPAVRGFFRSGFEEIRHKAEDGATVPTEN
jgi:hypothetical protein